MLLLSTQIGPSSLRTMDSYPLSNMGRGNLRTGPLGHHRGDFAHSLMILYAVASLTPKFGAVRAATISVGLYALHNIMYAAISYPAGVLADRFNKRVLLALGYTIGAATALMLALNITSIPALIAVFILGGAYVGMEETPEDSL